MTKTTATADVSVASFIMAHRVPIVCAACVIVVGLFAYIGGSAIAEHTTSKALADIDTIIAAATDGSATLSEEELDGRRNVAFTALNKYLSRRGVAGVRANMAAAELAFSKGEWGSAATYWTCAAEKSKKSYTASLCHFNAGVASENAGNLDAALASYKIASADSDFLLKAHAQFSLARSEEALGKKEAALADYQKLIDDAPDSSWGRLAKTKVLSMGDDAVAISAQSSEDAKDAEATTPQDTQKVVQNEEKKE